MTSFPITTTGATASTASPAQISTLPVPAATNAPLGPRTIPTFIGADEVYYWSSPWQEDVREAMAARAAGESVLFDSDDPNDVVRWLLADEDEGEA